MGLPAVVVDLDHNILVITIDTLVKNIGYGHSHNFDLLVGSATAPASLPEMGCFGWLGVLKE